MYELKKKIAKVFTAKSAGTGPSSYKKKLPGRGLTRLRNTVLHLSPYLKSSKIYDNQPCSGTQS